MSGTLNFTRRSHDVKPPARVVSPSMAFRLRRSDVFVSLFCSLEGSLEYALRSLIQCHRSVHRAEKGSFYVYDFVCGDHYWWLDSKVFDCYAS